MGIAVVLVASKCLCGYVLDELRWHQVKRGAVEDWSEERHVIEVDGAESATLRVQC
jgi:hypothetical protein